jgi:hypothetical protein
MRRDKHIACMVKVKVKFTLKQAMNARNGLELLYSFFNLGAR